MRQKLLAAFLTTLGLPLLVIAVFSFSYYLGQTERAAVASLHDKLNIGSLILENASMGLLTADKRIAGDNSVLVSLELQLVQPIKQYLETLRTTQNLDYAFILDPSGERLLAGPSGGDAGLPVLPREVLGLAMAGEGIGFCQTGSGPTAAGSATLYMLALIPLRNGEQNLLGFACIGYRFGPDGGEGGRQILANLEQRIGAACFLATAGGMVSASAMAAGLGLHGAVLPNGLPEAGEHSQRVVRGGVVNWWIESIGLPGAAGKAVAYFGVAMPESELLATRNITLLVIILMFLLAFAFSFLAANWFAGFISRPITAVAQGTRAIIEGNFDFRFEVQGRDEIGLMTEDFAVMALQLRKLVQELNQEIAEHTRAEAQIRTLNNELEERVSKRTRELSQSNMALAESLELLQTAQKELVESEKMAALSHVVVGVAHELNTPLGNSLTAVSYIESRTDDIARLLAEGSLTRGGFEEMLGVLREAAAITRQNLQRAGKMVGFFKQMAVNLDDESPQAVQLHALVEDVIRGMQIQAPESRIAAVNGVADSIIVHTRTGALFRVLASLAENACSHAFVGVDKGTITFEAIQEPDWLEIRVSDDGGGIPPDYLDRIFEPFVTTGRGRGHVGLGLSIVFNLVTGRLGGNIHCESRPGQGAVFFLRLPSVKVS